MVHHQKVAFITGAARRIGAEIAHILHKNGMNVVIHYRTLKNEAESLCQELNRKRAHSAHIVQCDLSKTTDFSELLQSVVSYWGRLDVLVNNAAQFYRTPLETCQASDWDALIDCNVKAPFFLSQAAAPFLRQVQGSIICLTDFHGEKPLSDYSIYSISKAGLIMLTKALAQELAPDIRVNAVSPSGGACWPEGDNDLSDHVKEKIIEKTTLKREGNSLEIAHAVLFLVKDARYITGEILRVDGGRLLL